MNDIRYRIPRHPLQGITVLLLLLMAACSDSDNGLDDPTPPEPVPAEITVEADTESLRSVEPSGGSITVSLTATAQWTATVEDAGTDHWLSVSPASGRAGETTVTLTIAANESPDARSASVVFVCGDDEETLTVTQQQGDVLAVSQEVYELPATANTMNEKPALKIVYRQVADLIPYARNARTHSDEQVTRIASSIKEFGFTNPILIDGDNGIIAGHGRLMAAKKLGMREVPTIELSGMSDAQKRAYILADNKLALNSTWDYETLKIELSSLDEIGYEIGLTGFSDSEFNNLFGLIDENDIESAKVVENFSVVVDFETEEEQETFFAEMKERGYKCHLST